MTAAIRAAQLAIRSYPAGSHEQYQAMTDLAYAEADRATMGEDESRFATEKHDKKPTDVGLNNGCGGVERHATTLCEQDV